MFYRNIQERGYDNLKNISMLSFEINFSNPKCNQKYNIMVCTKIIRHFDYEKHKNTAVS